MIISLLSSFPGTKQLGQQNLKFTGSQKIPQYSDNIEIIYNFLISLMFRRRKSHCLYGETTSINLNCSLVSVNQNQTNIKSFREGQQGEQRRLMQEKKYDSNNHHKYDRQKCQYQKRQPMKKTSLSRSGNQSSKNYVNRYLEKTTKESKFFVNDGKSDKKMKGHMVQENQIESEERIKQFVLLHIGSKNSMNEKVASSTYDALDQQVLSKKRKDPIIKNQVLFKQCQRVNTLLDLRMKKTTTLGSSINSSNQNSLVLESSQVSENNRLNKIYKTMKSVKSMGIQAKQSQK